MTRAVKVGIFVIGGIGLFCLGLVLIGSRAHLFGSHFTVYAQFKDTSAITGGSMVRVGGMDAGQIDSIEVPKQPDAPFRLTLHVDKKFRPLVRVDSVASIQTEGMVGNKFVNIAPGSDKAAQCSGCTLKSQEPVSTDALMRKGNDLADSMQSTINDLHKRADAAMENITSLTAHADGMIKAVQPNVVQLTQNANAVVAGIRNGQGTAGKLLTDKKTADDVAATIENAKQASGNFNQTSQKVNSMVAQIQSSDLPAIHQTVANAQSMTQQMNQAVGTILAKNKQGESTAESIRSTVQQAQQTTTNMADDTDALKHNLFLRGFFHRRGFFDLQTLTPATYADTEFVKKPRARVWIPADGLFQKAADGSQQLTSTGQSTVDRYMSRLVRYLPNNPIVVEGYAAAGSAADQYLSSRQRAEAVSQYLQSKFRLKPDHVGVMPLGNHPPEQTGKSQWDGICLALVVAHD